MRAFALLTLSLLAIAPTAHATVTSQSNTGFLTSHSVSVPGTPQAAYDAFLKISTWWDGAHSFSGSAANLSLDDKQGGCWCETLENGGFVRHMSVVRAMPGKTLVLSGGLGPLQSMGVSGALTIDFRQDGAGTSVTWQYAVGGYDPGGFTELSKGVDHVLGEQAERYRKVASGETP